MPVPEVRERAVEQSDLASDDRHQAEQRTHQGGLAGPVGTQHRDDLALAYVEIDPSQNGAAVELDGDVADLDQAHRQSFASWIAARLTRMRER